MSKKVFLSLLIAALLLVFLGCVPLTTPSKNGGEETPVNIVINGDFSDPTLGWNLGPSATSTWFAFTDWGAGEAATITNGVAYVKVTSQGAETYHNQLSQWIDPVPDKTYTFSFDASSSINTDVVVKITYFGNQPNFWEAYWWDPVATTVNITPEATTFSFVFNSHETDSPSLTGTCVVKLTFEFGKAATGAEIYIDNVQIVEQQ